jgi:hypothetical protein
MCVPVATGMRPAASECNGQSVLEFLLMLPLMVGLVVLLVRANTAIQISIVNQQYARAQALFLTFNSPTYPQLELRQPHVTAKQYNQMIIGVADNPAPEDGSPYIPDAATQNVTRRKSGTRDEAKTEPRERDKVRIRDTVTICTQVNIVPGQGGALVPVLEMGGPRFSVPVGKNNLTDQSAFQFCRAPVEYIINNEGEDS